MVPNAKITAGSIVKIHNWHGVVLETHYDANGNLSVLQVQTVRNIFRGYGPEYIDIRLQPDAVEPATLADLQQEIETHHRLLDGALSRMLAAVTSRTDIPVSAD